MFDINKKYQVDFNALYLCAGIGGGAKGFQDSVEEYKGIMGKIKTLAGIDNDPLACEDFERITGAPAFCMDLFERRDYIAFHGQEPPEDWKEVTPEDIKNTTKGISPDIVFVSAPCKGLSALLPAKNAASEKYQALNRLTVRCIFLTLEAYRDNLPGIILFENVPRIKTRGKSLLNTIKGTLRAYGYVFHEADHDCGEIGGLGQHRKRYLLIARNPNKVTSFVYKPPKMRVRAIGEILGSLPMPGDIAAGPMHRLPNLQFKTWLRLALIPEGGDWRDLEKVAPEEYCLEYVPRGGGPYGVMEWDKPSCTVIGNAGVKGSNAAAVADHRIKEAATMKQRDSRHPGVYQVVRYNEPGPCVTGTRFGSGAPAVADIKTGFNEGTHHTIYRVSKYNEPSKTVTGAMRPNNGAISIADPRLNKNKGYSNKFQMLNWSKPSSTVTGIADIQAGASSIADPRLNCKPRSGTMGVQDWNKPSVTVIGAGDIHASAASVADPRIPKNNDQGVWIIISEDGKWHRPLTTLELAAIQGFDIVMPDGSPLVLAGRSDGKWRERVGNAVPPPTAKAIGESVMRALLPSIYGEWVLGATEIWVMPYEISHTHLELAIYVGVIKV